MSYQSNKANANTTVAVAGAGTIGRGFAILFASAGFRVRLYDPDGDQRAAASGLIASTLSDLADHDLIDETPAAILGRIALSDDIADAVSGAVYVQECAPEREDLKRSLFAALDAAAPPETVLASASSAMPASRFASGLPGAVRCLVAHPGNPPFLLRVIELVPAPFTSAETLERAESLLKRAGLKPVYVRREVEGFVFNRLQGAVLREAYCLVRDGVASVADIDLVMRDGLGMRWAVVGPFETVDLNTQGGIEAHAQRLGPAYERMGAERGQHDPWTPELVAQVASERRTVLPLDRWQERTSWRDRALMALLAHRRRVCD